MAGYVIYNGFWNAHEPSPPVRQLMAAAGRQGWSLIPRKNTEITVALTENGVETGLSAVDFVLFWDKDVRLARALEANGVRLYNPAEAVAVCDDKAATHLRLAQAGLPQPLTLVAPMTYREMDAAAEPFLQAALRTLSFPMVVKECFGSFGGQVFLAPDETALRALVAARGSRPFLLQAFAAREPGCDRRLYVVGDRVAAAMERRNETDFRANIAAGGHGRAITPSAEETALALACCRALGLDFAGVDLLTGPDGRSLVCEVNASAYLAEISTCTGVDVANELVSYVRESEARRRA